MDQVGSFWWTINCLSVSIFASTHCWLSWPHALNCLFESRGMALMMADEDAACEQAHCIAAVCANYLIKLAITTCLLKQILPTTTAYLYSNECPSSWRKNSIDETLIACLLWVLLWIYHHNNHYLPLVMERTPSLHTLKASVTVA